MLFNDHSNLKGAHAFLSASKYAWDRYSEEKLIDTFRNAQAAKRGTELHAYAAEAIRLGIRQRATRQTLNMYINDAIGFRMNPEQVLFYSVNCFGTADTISFKKNKLRIHDLKTGESATSFRQHEIYGALFCLEYAQRPGEIEMEFRTYQLDECLVHVPEVETIAELMSRIVSFDKIIEKMKREEE